MQNKKINIFIIIVLIFGLTEIYILMQPAYIVKIISKNTITAKDHVSELKMYKQINGDRDKKNGCHQGSPSAISISYINSIFILTFKTKDLDNLDRCTTYFINLITKDSKISNAHNAFSDSINFEVVKNQYPKDNFKFANIIFFFVLFIKRKVIRKIFDEELIAIIKKTS